MKFKITAINHIGLVVKDQSESEKFYCDTLGLEHHPDIDSWLILNDHSTLHLIEISDAAVDSSIYHEVQHFALQVDNLRQLLTLCIDYHPFQMDNMGNIKEITDTDDSLDFGIGTLFVPDPDRNLVEFVEIGKGVFRET